MTRYSTEFDSLLRKKVKATFYDSRTETGYLINDKLYSEYNIVGFTPYCIVAENYNFGFYKSHIKKVSEVVE